MLHAYILRYCSVAVRLMRASAFTILLGDVAAKHTLWQCFLGEIAAGCCGDPALDVPAGRVLLADLEALWQALLAAYASQTFAAVMHGDQDAACPLCGAALQIMWPLAHYCAVVDTGGCDDRLHVPLSCSQRCDGLLWHGWC
jgi:hypothetical protein